MKRNSCCVTIAATLAVPLFGCAAPDVTETYGSSFSQRDKQVRHAANLGYPTGRSPTESGPSRLSGHGLHSRAPYRIGRSDVLALSVFNVPELSVTATVTDGGTIDVPLIGDINAAGRSVRDVEREIANKLGATYLQDPRISLRVKEGNSHRVTLEGAVKVPGIYPINADTSLLQLIAAARGLSHDADATVTIIRQADGERTVTRVDIQQVRAGRAPDPPLIAGDTIIAGQSALKKGFESLLKLLPITGSLALL